MQYTNTNYVIAGLLIESVTGRPAADVTPFNASAAGMAGSLISTSVGRDDGYRRMAGDRT